MRVIKQATLAKAIEADLLSARPEREATPTCFCCGREHSGRFCSARCHDGYDAGFPSFERQRETARGFPDPSKPFFVVAGGVPDCMRCGDPCIETARGKRGEPYCGWRCRDDKPQDCAICGKGRISVIFHISSRVGLSESVRSGVRSGQWSQYACDQTRRSRPTFSLPDPSARLRLRASVVGASIVRQRHPITKFHHTHFSIFLRT
jgi:hypothetical protein